MSAAPGHSPDPSAGPQLGPGTVSIIGLAGIPEINQGHHLGSELRLAMERNEVALRDGDVIVLSSKIISKNSGLAAAAADRELAIRGASVRVVAERRTPSGVTRIVESGAGPVMAAAGVDASNTGQDGIVLLLPTDPDLAARSVYAELLVAYSPNPLPRIGVIITDTAGRPWRLGQTDIALGSCAVAIVDDLTDAVDADGRPLAVTSRAIADQIAAAADLVKGKVWATPAAVVRGLPAGTVVSPGAAGASHLVRTGPQDWFALGSMESVRAAMGAAPGSFSADAVGVPSAAPEADLERVQRAIRLALLGSGLAEHRYVRIDAEHKTCTLHADDEYSRGRIAARLEIALASEGLTDWSLG